MIPSKDYTFVPLRTVMQFNSNMSKMARFLQPQAIRLSQTNFIEVKSDEGSLQIGDQVTVVATAKSDNGGFPGH